MRVLVVDDMGAMRQTVKRALVSLGIVDILQAKNGKEAWEMIVAGLDRPDQRIDLAIVDWNMLPMPGIDLLKQIRADRRFSDLLFVMLTAEQLKDNIIVAIQSGVDEYIVKPFTQGALREKLDRLTVVKLSQVKKEIDHLFARRREESPGEPPPDDEYERMRERTRKLSGLSPWSHTGSLFMGRVALRYGKLEDAEAWLRITIAKNFGVVEAHDLLSKVLRKMGKVEASLAELTVAAVERPADAGLKRRMGEAYLKAGRLDEAVATLAEALRLTQQGEKNPRKIAAGKSALGAALVAHGAATGNRAEENEGVADLEEATRADPDLLAAHYNLMVAYRKTGRDEAAAEVFARVSAMEPNDADGWVALGQAYADQEEKGRALFAFGKAAALADGRYDVYETVGVALHRAGWGEEALGWLEKATQANPSSVLPYNLRGLIYRRAGRHLEAVGEYEKGVALVPADAGLHFNLGVAYFTSGQEEKSRPWFEKAKALAPTLEGVDDYLARFVGG
ncbi:MAG: tetratricopeptide repeat protein [Nitrospinae bacterium]|nr:tetratricopeptide repeat protein [Nitrospinota bacterium]